jgi:asparagine synthase (glutamine-hydrolysing)
MYCLSKKVHEHQIKVVMTGEGADEMLAGYDIFKEAIIREFWSRYPDSRLRPLLFAKLYPYLAQFKSKNRNALKFFYGYQLNQTDSPFYSHLLRWKNTSSLFNYLSPEIRQGIRLDESHEKIRNLLPQGFEKYSLLAKSQWLETSIFMSGYLLSSQGDRMAMANSVEGRYPFLDYRVIEFAAQLPPMLKMKGLNEKFVLKHLMAGKLPERVLKRPKQAYRAPGAGYLLNQPKDYMIELLSESDLKQTGLFDFKSIQALLEKIRNSSMVTELDNMALTAVISTQLLYHQFILNDHHKPDTGALNACMVIHEKNALVP